MRVDLFDFELPQERIALRPAEPRDSARMLVVRPDAFEDRCVRDLPQFLASGDVLVVNDTRVIPARLNGIRVRGENVARIEATLQGLPWLVSLDDAGGVSGYAYAGRHRERAAYQWSVETTVYVGEGSRGKGVGRALYSALFEELVRLGYYQAFAGITLPNAASVALHEGLGFAPIGIYRQVGHKLGRWHDVGWWQRPLQEPVAAPLPPRRFAGALAR